MIKPMFRGTIRFSKCKAYRRYNRSYGPAGSYGESLKKVMAGVPLLLLAGCGPSPGAEPPPVSQIWQERQGRSSVEPAEPLPPSAADSKPIAMVNGQPIGRDLFFRLLLAGRGAEVLEGLIVLDLARQRAEAEGVVVTARDVEAEYTHTLSAMLNALPAADDRALDQEVARRFLERILADRGISDEEFRLGLRRKAYLRRLALAQTQLFSDQEVKAEFSRTYGRRVRIRHIQLAGRTEVDRIVEQLKEGGDFGELAEQYSANTVTAPSGGLLKPFSRDDPDVPAVIRQVAFQLEVGEVSDPLRADNWYHLIRVEEQLPAVAVTIDEVRDEVESRLRRRQADQRMSQLSAELFDQARIEVLDPLIEPEFWRRHPDRRP